MSLDELLSLPVSVDLTTAGRAFGIGRTKSFELARQGRFPVKVISVGAKYRVTRSCDLRSPRTRSSHRHRRQRPAAGSAAMSGLGRHARV